MRNTLKTVATLVLGGLGMACGATRGKSETGFARFAGVYRFEERVSPDVYLDGRFLVQPDTIELELRNESCRVEPTQSRMEHLTYICGENIILRFDRLYPIARTTYVARVVVTETRQVCARYVTNAQGQQICAEYRRESYQRVATRSGRLRPQKLEGAEWNSLLD